MKKFENYCSNLVVLSQAYQQDLENEFILGGIINKFFLQFELSWKVLKECLQYEGRAEGNSGSPREILKAAHTIYDFLEEEVWLSMLRDRNLTTHLYDGAAARKLTETILSRYIPAFQGLQEALLQYYPHLAETV